MRTTNESLGETPPTAYFEDTTIQTLNVYHDLAWLADFSRYPHPIDEPYITYLNYQVNLSQGSTAAAEKLMEEPLRRLSDTRAAVARDARRRFYFNLLRREVKQGYRDAPEYAAAYNVSPIKVVSISRLLHLYTGADFSQVLQRGPRVYGMNEESLFGRLTALEEAGIDPRKVLLTRPHMLLSNTDRESLIRRGAKAQTDYDKAAPRVAAYILMPKIANPSPPIEVKNPDRYAQLEATTGIATGVLQAAFPQLDQLQPAAFSSVVVAAETIANKFIDHDLRIRDIAPCIPQIAPRE